MRKITLTAVILLTVIIVAPPLPAQEEPAAKKTQEKAAEGALRTEIELVEIEPFPYCSVEMTGSYEQHPAAFMQLYSESSKQGLPMTGAPFGIYWNSPDETAEEELKWEIGMPVPEDKEIQAPLASKMWEYKLVVQRDFEGVIDSEDMNAVYAEIAGWIEKNGYEPAGPMLERFLSTPSPNENGEFIGKVQIIFPVKKAEK